MENNKKDLTDSKFSHEQSPSNSDEETRKVFFYEPELDEETDVVRSIN